MNTFQTASLSKPKGSEKISAGILTYMRARLRQRIHSMILREFERSDISQADLARRLGRQPRVVHRWLASPENMRLSTLSDLVFAMTGGEPSDRVEQPLDMAPGNHTIPNWLAEALDERKLEQKTPSETRTFPKQVIVHFENEPA